MLTIWLDMGARLFHWAAIWFDDVNVKPQSSARFRMFQPTSALTTSNNSSTKKVRDLRVFMCRTLGGDTRPTLSR
eukprot:9499744-Pyramimonas_sp.AAC.1